MFRKDYLFQSPEVTYPETIISHSLELIANHDTPQSRT